jgi:predicted porin
MNTRFLKINFYFVIFLIIGVSSNIYASHEFYGRIAIDSQSISNNFLKGTETDIKSNESKFGIKGNFLLSNNSNLKLVYQAEYGFDPIDGKARGDYGTFKKRNTFIGIQTDLGMLFAGTHDSAFKKSQLKIDLYNDLAPDIKNILHGENRLEDFIGYTTPKYMGKISATFNSIKNPSSSGKKYRSYSINFSGDLFQAAIGG